MYSLPFLSNIAFSIKFTGYGDMLNSKISKLQIIAKAKVIFWLQKIYSIKEHLWLKNNLKLLFDSDNKFVYYNSWKELGKSTFLLITGDFQSL